jgi:hypothetical protein
MLSGVGTLTLLVYPKPDWISTLSFAVAPSAQSDA